MKARILFAIALGALVACNAPGQVVSPIQTATLPVQTRTARFPTAGDLYVGFVSHKFGGLKKNGRVVVFGPKSPTPIARIFGIYARFLAFDRSRQLYIGSDFHDFVSTYAPGQTTPSRTTTNAVEQPVGMAIGGSLFVANGGDTRESYSGRGSVTVYDPTSGDLVSTITTGISYPTSVAVDGAGNLYVASCFDGTVTTYSNGGTAPSQTLSFPGECPWQLAVDSQGYLYVDILGSGPATCLPACSSSATSVGRVVVYAPGGSTRVRTIFPGRVFGNADRATHDWVSAITLDRSNHLYAQVSVCLQYRIVRNYQSCIAFVAAVRGYANYGRSVIRTIRFGDALPITPGLAVDSTGIVYLLACDDKFCKHYETILTYERGSKRPSRRFVFDGWVSAFALEPQ